MSHNKFRQFLFSVTSMVERSLNDFGDSWKLGHVIPKVLPSILSEVFPVAGETEMKQRYNHTELQQGAVMSGAESSIQTLVVEVFTNAHYIHCYAHQLNLIMSNFVSQNKRVKIKLMDFHFKFSARESIQFFVLFSTSHASCLYTTTKFSHKMQIHQRLKK